MKKNAHIKPPLFATLPPPHTPSWYICITFTKNVNFSKLKLKLFMATSMTLITFIRVYQISPQRV